MNQSAAFSNSCDPVSIALAEDIGGGDITSQLFVAPDRTGLARVIAKQPAVIAGAEVAAETFLRVDPATSVSVLRPSGAAAEPGDLVLEVSGAVRSILAAERVALNFLQQLSGVATLTSRYVKAAGRSTVKILDTRKTTPGLRALQKAAVRAGGGANHRFGLYDMVMVKDNHLHALKDLATLQETIRRARAERGGIRIEIEADTLAQVEMFAALDGVDVVLLDNMSVTMLRSAVELVNGRVELEASGGVTLENIAAIAATGVNAISVGALTHSAPAIDFSLELV